MRVIKLGGSLLESADSLQRVMRWLKNQRPLRSLILVGGGGPVDAIRQLAEVHDCPEEFWHWLCIEAMEISFRIVEQQLGCGPASETWTSLTTAEQLYRWLREPNSPFALVRVNAFYSKENFQQQPIALPLSWDTTSDSLAALLAATVDAEELVLFKSCRVEPPLDAYDWQALADAGVVDRAFPTAVKHVRHARHLSLWER